MIPTKNTDRGASTVIGYILAITITTVLLIGIVSGITSFLREQQSSTARGELSVVAQEIAVTVDRADRRSASTDNIYRKDVTVPSDVAGEQYRISLDSTVGDSDNYEIVLSTTDGQVSQRVPIAVQDGRSVCVRSCSTPNTRITVGQKLVVELTSSNNVVIRNGQ